jgi:hypothetical protein
VELRVREPATAGDHGRVVGAPACRIREPFVHEIAAYVGREIRPSGRCI